MQHRPADERAPGAGDPDRGRTVIELERAGDGWTATQRGVDLVGRGPTAARAAAAYCRLVVAEG
ncbi:MAG: hypothetical protein ABEJ42_03445 [Halobacteriaceae archaeon]